MKTRSVVHFDNSKRNASNDPSIYFQWLSPEGCALFSMQLHIDLDSQLGRTVSMIQHLLATAIVNSILSQDGYEVS